MASDREILREVWEGKLPVCFKIDIEEVVDIKMPDPYYLMVPRLSYFPLVTDKVNIFKTCYYCYRLVCIAFAYSPRCYYTSVFKTIVYLHCFKILTLVNI